MPVITNNTGKVNSDNRERERLVRILGKQDRQQNSRPAPWNLYANRMSSICSKTRNAACYGVSEDTAAICQNSESHNTVTPSMPAITARPRFLALS